MLSLAAILKKKQPLQWWTRRVQASRRQAARDPEARGEQTEPGGPRVETELPRVRPVLRPDPRGPAAALFSMHFAEGPNRTRSTNHPHPNPSRRVSFPASEATSHGKKGQFPWTKHPQTAVSTSRPEVPQTSAYPNCPITSTPTSPTLMARSQAAECQVAIVHLQVLPSRFASWIFSHEITNRVTLCPILMDPILPVVAGLLILVTSVRILYWLLLLWLPVNVFRWNSRESAKWRQPFVVCSCWHSIPLSRRSCSLAIYWFHQLISQLVICNCIRMTQICLDARRTESLSANNHLVLYPISPRG